MKKLVCLMIAVLMAVGCFAGCTSGADVTATTTEPTLTTTEVTETTTTEEVAAGTEEITIAEVEVDTATMTYSESPDLAEKVAAGELPPVEERIPDVDNVYVETTMRDGTALEIGTYGGVIRQAKSSKFGDWDCCRFTSLERPVDFYKDGSSYLNVLKGLEHNEDYTVWTMYLREGMKWSDGEDFTADDITFWYYMLHKNNYDGIDYWIACWNADEDGNRIWADVEKVDDYTVTWTFNAPKYSANFTDTGDFKWCYAPQHYWANKVPSSYYQENPYWEDTGLSDEEVLANFLAEGMEFANVIKAGNAAYKPWKYYQIPTLAAWMVTSEEGFNNNECEIFKFVRNPYYWKVDAEGNQLPYIDEIWCVQCNDTDQCILKLESGEADFTNVDIEDVVAVQDAMGDAVETKVLKSTAWGAYQICFNLTHPDENMKTLMNTYAFRKAISISVDRQDVCNLWYDGLTTPHNASPQYPNIGYSEERANYNAEYDPDEAVRLLTEECGLVMGSDGYFDFADGTDLEITLLHSATDTTSAEKMAVLTNYWAAVGLKVNYKQDAEASTVFDSHDGGWDMAVCGTSLNGYRFESRPKVFVPMHKEETWYALYDQYGTVTGAEYFDAHEVEELGKICDLYEEWLLIPELADRLDLEYEMQQILIENQWVVAYSTQPDKYYMVRAGYGNWADEMLDEDKFNYYMMWNWWTIYDTTLA